MSNVVGWVLFAMAAVETSHDPNAVGDGGRAIGAYQIHYAYWQDSGIAGDWEDCRDATYAQRVVLAYWSRYCPDALNSGNIERLCRVHNGGPHGDRKRRTFQYWRKVERVLRQIATSVPDSGRWHDQID